MYIVCVSIYKCVVVLVLDYCLWKREDVHQHAGVCVTVHFCTSVCFHKARQR